MNDNDINNLANRLQGFDSDELQHTMTDGLQQWCERRVERARFARRAVASLMLLVTISAVAMTTVPSLRHAVFRPKEAPVQEQPSPTPRPKSANTNPPALADDSAVALPIVQPTPVEPPEGPKMPSVGPLSRWDLFIDEYAFYSCESLTQVVLPASLDTMGQGCFEYCNALTSVDIPDGLHTVPNSAFFGDDALSQITWGNGVTVIDSFAFGVCPFGELYLPATLRSVWNGAFNGYYDGTLRRVVFSAPVDTIEPEVFTGHHLESLRLMNSVPPVSLTTLDYGADYGCLFEATVDSIIIPCGSRAAYLADTYWGQFDGKYYEDCNGINVVSDGEISVYPNPATDRVIVQGIQDGICVEVVNMLGQNVLLHKIFGSKVELDVRRLERGVYYLFVHTTAGIITRKVVLR